MTSGKLGCRIGAVEVAGQTQSRRGDRRRSGTSTCSVNAFPYPELLICGTDLLESIERINQQVEQMTAIRFRCDRINKLSCPFLSSSVSHKAAVLEPTLNPSQEIVQSSKENLVLLEEAYWPISWGNVNEIAGINVISINATKIAR